MSGDDDQAALDLMAFWEQTWVDDRGVRVLNYSAVESYFLAHINLGGQPQPRGPDA